jgi:hypothetical protein
LEGIDPGVYLAVADKERSAPQGYGVSQPGLNGFIAVNDPDAISGAASTISVKAGESVRDLTFQLTLAAVASGRILDASGEPMVGVRVELLPAGYDAIGRRIALPLARSGTNDRRECRLFNVKLGRYYLRASVSRSVLIQQGLARAAEIARNAPDEERRYVPTYFPGVSDITRATVF